MRNQCLALALAGATFTLPTPIYAQSGPSTAVRTSALRSLVYVVASGCPDGKQRAGTGFVLDAPSRIVTAHHVVGGCTTVKVKYEAFPDSSLYSALISRVYSAGDIAILSVGGAPAAPALRRAPPPPDRNEAFAAMGYQNGQLSAGDLRVTFSVGSQKLRSILTPDILRQLTRIGSPINVLQDVLRFNTALQPGMSGGPIIDDNGRVIGIVAGGLKAGAAPASWGWPSEWIVTAASSNEPVGTPIHISGAYYTREDIEAVAVAASNTQTLTCGNLDFTFHGTRSFQEIRPGADDIARLDYLVRLSSMSQADIDALRFDIWVHEPSGATAVTPFGYVITEQGGTCVAQSATTPLTEVIWASPAPDPASVQTTSSTFEQTVMAPRVPSYPFQIDQALTTFAGAVPGPQYRENGMVFNRKGFIHSLVPFPFPGSDTSHSFETLIAKSGTFLGVGTIYGRKDPRIVSCLQAGWPSTPQCMTARSNMNEWTHFVLATQLSTYPLY